MWQSIDDRCRWSFIRRRVLRRLRPRQVIFLIVLIVLASGAAVLSRRSPAVPAGSGADFSNEMVVQEFDQLKRTRWPWEEGRRQQLVIPTIIHHFFSDKGGLPSRLLPEVTSWSKVNSNFTIYLWDSHNFEASVLPGFSKYMRYYWLNSTTRFERDLLAKLLILHEFGGVFVESNMKALAPISEYLSDTTCLIAQERVEKAILMYNYEVLPSLNFVACQRQHPFLLFFLRKITEIELRTGAKVLQVNTVEFVVHVYTAALSAFEDECNKVGCNFNSRVVLAEPEIFMPIIEDGYYDNFVTTCRSDPRELTYQQREACYNLEMNKNQPGANSLAMPVYQQPWRRSRDTRVPLIRVVRALAGHKIVHKWGNDKLIHSAVG